jgi:hypothetical protein
MARSNQSPGEQAARFSLYAPLVVFVIGIFSRSSHGELGVAIALFSINVFLIIVGFGLGVLALFSMQWYGPERILGRAVGGVLLNGLLMVFILFFMLPLLTAGRVKGQLAGHWQKRPDTASAGVQLDLTLADDGAFHFTSSGDPHGPVVLDGKWAMTPMHGIRLNIERVDVGSPSAVGKNFLVGTVKTIDDKQLILRTETGEEAYDKIP